MSWDTPSGWQEPREAAAAAEVARRAEEERQVEDARAQTLADAVRLGFADLASAIVCAAGPEAIEAWNSRTRVGDLAKYAPPSADGFNEAPAQPDSDIDDLIDQP